MALARKNLVIQDEDGNIVDGASIEVRSESTGLLPQLYSNRAGSSALGNPFTAADGADAGFHVVGGSYKITATKSGFQRIWRYEAVGTAAEFDSEVLLANLIENNLHIKDFGALGDGSTDDTAALNSAFASGAKVIDAGGLNCLISSSVTIPAGVVVRNLKVTVGVITGINAILVNTGSKLINPIVVGSGTTGVVERGISPAADSVTDVVIENCDISNLTYGIHPRPVTSTSSSRWRITGHIHDIVGVAGNSEGYGILLEGAVGCQIECTFKTIRRHAIYFSAGAQHNNATVYVDGCGNFASQFFSNSGQTETAHNRLRIWARNLTTDTAGQSGAVAIVQKAHRNTVIVDIVGNSTTAYAASIEGSSGGPYPIDNIICDGQIEGQFTAQDVIRCLNADGTHIFGNTINAYATVDVIGLRRTGTNGASHGGFVRANSIDAQGQSIKGVYDECNTQPSVIAWNVIKNNSSATKIDDQSSSSAIIFPMLAVSGDVTLGVDGAVTFKTVNSNVGTFGSATKASIVTINGKGLVTAASESTVTPAASSITGAGDLTRTNDTNVTLTLGGTPTGALLKATSLTVGWSGTLAASRGGFGADVSGSSGVPLFATGTPTFIGTSGTGNFARVGAPAFTSPSMTGDADVQEAFYLSGDISPTALSGNVDDYNPTGNSTATVLKIDGGAADRNITGITSVGDGRIKIIINVGATNSLILKDQTTSTAGNRFKFGGDITLAPNQGVSLIYDAAASRWRCVGVFTSGGGGGGSVTSITTTYPMQGGTITTSGTISLADQFRQNALLERIYQSKSFADTRRLIQEVAVGYKAASDTSNGVDTVRSFNYLVDITNGRVAPSQTASGTPSYANTGGTGDRTASITVTANAGTFDGSTLAANKLLDGDFTANYTHSVAMAAASSSGKWILYDFGSGASKLITEAKWYQSASNSHGTYQWQGSNDGSNFTNIGATFTLGGATTQTQTTLSGNATGYRYYRLLGISGTDSGTPFCEEIEFKIDNATLTTNNMTLVLVAQTADASVSNGRVLIEYDPIDATTLNTDLTAEVSCKAETATVTISNASPGVISQTAHGLLANDSVFFTTTGSLPTGLTASTVYFVKTVVDANSYTVSATPGGSAINTSSAGSGTHTANFHRWAAATLSSVGTGQAGRSVAETADTAGAASGTTFRRRIKTFNNKMIRIYGDTYTVH